MKHLKLFEQFSLILESIYDDVSVRITNKERGVSQPGAKSFDIFFNNKEVVRKMMNHKMGQPGSMQSFWYEGLKTNRDDQYTTYEWTADTTAWEVWKHMNYIILTPKNQIHWYHGKKPGGSKYDPIDSIGFRGSKGEDLPTLDIEHFGFKVYRALLDDPNAGYIISESGSSPEVKKSVYKHLFKEKDYIWIKAGDPKALSEDPLAYDMVVVMNPKYCNPKEVEEKFKNIEVPVNDRPTYPNLNADFTYSDNFKSYA